MNSCNEHMSISMFPMQNTEKSLEKMAQHDANSTSKVKNL